jgi:hypothetical protein
MGLIKMNRFSHIAAAAFLATGLGLAQSATPAAQPPKPAAAKPAWPPEGPMPRTADGKPDFSGNWAPNAIRENVNLAGVLAAAGTPVPMLPDAAKIHQQRQDSLSKDDPEGFCLPPGVPRMSTTPYPWTMIQTPQLLAIVYEGGAHIWRKIFLDGRPHDPKVEYTWLGDSVGHWEGDTLVFTTVALKGSRDGDSILDRTGLVLSDKAHATTRMRKTAATSIEVQMTIEDPKALTKPWMVTKTFQKMPAGTRLYDYGCAENNRNPVDEKSGKTLTLGPDGKPLN